MDEDHSIEQAAFRTRGLLAGYPPRLLAEIRANAPDLFDFCDSINEHAMALAWSLRPRKSRPGQPEGAALFLKALNSFQAAVLLASRGMCVESETIIKTAYECTFELGALAAEPTGHAQAMASAQRRHQATHADRLLHNIAAQGVPVDAKFIEHLKEVAAFKGDGTKIQASAEKAGMLVLFDTYYRALSGHAAHATLGALERLLKQRGDTTTVQIGPDVDQLPLTLLFVSPVLVECFPPLGKLFELPELARDADAFRIRMSHILPAAVRAMTAINGQGRFPSSQS